ncbi:MAG: hypothetical protein UT82_C0015G0018 [Parcubacteria group bacterium GW2011_GWB1_40_14]|nr:MAG: hypothetical protein UT82_C0015G0018 [Parcubacteria group bacterium GW2011_GWB1_40_14]
MFNLLNHIPFLNRRPVSTRDKFIFVIGLILAFLVILFTLFVIMSKQAVAPAPSGEETQRGFSYETKTAPCADDPQVLCDKILRPDYKFSAVAPKDWTVSQPNSGTLTSSKDGLDCSASLILGSNENYVSASGWVDILNPPGKKSASIDQITGSVVNVGPELWPVAVMTTKGKFANFKKEAYIPVGNVVFILTSEIKGLVEQNKFTVNPQKVECDKAFDDLINSIRVR